MPWWLERGILRVHFESHVVVFGDNFKPVNCKGCNGFAVELFLKYIVIKLG